MALGWLLNLDFAGGTAVVVTVPDQPGIEHTLPTNRMHHTATANLPHHTLKENRPHYAVPEEGNQ